VIYKQEFLLTDAGWEAIAQLPSLTDVIVEGVILEVPHPNTMHHLQDPTINRSTAAQLASVWEFDDKELNAFVHCSSLTRTVYFRLVGQFTATSSLKAHAHLFYYSVRINTRGASVCCE
jgi:hypothetical protein